MYVSGVEFVPFIVKAKGEEQQALRRRNGGGGSEGRGGGAQRKERGKQPFKLTWQNSRKDDTVFSPLPAVRVTSSVALLRRLASWPWEQSRPRCLPVPFSTNPTITRSFGTRLA